MAGSIQNYVPTCIPLARALNCFLFPKIIFGGILKFNVWTLEICQKLRNLNFSTNVISVVQGPAQWHSRFITSNIYNPVMVNNHPSPINRWFFNDDATLPILELPFCLYFWFKLIISHNYSPFPIRTTKGKCYKCQ